MPQDPIVYPVNAPNRKILITYKKVDKQAIQGNFNLTKSGYNWLEIIEDETLEIKGVTSLKIHNLGDEEVVINGFTLLPLPHLNEVLNKEIEGSTAFLDLVDKAIKRNAKIFVLPDGTYSDISLKINFLGTEKEIVKLNPPPVVFDVYNYDVTNRHPHFSPSDPSAPMGYENMLFTPNKAGNIQLEIQIGSYFTPTWDEVRTYLFNNCIADVPVITNQFFDFTGFYCPMGFYAKWTNLSTNEIVVWDNRR